MARLYPEKEWWMRLPLSHPPKSRRLFVVGSVCGIIGGLDLREPLDADGVNRFWAKRRDPFDGELFAIKLR